MSALYSRWAAGGQHVVAQKSKASTPPCNAAHRGTPVLPARSRLAPGAGLVFFTRPSYVDLEQVTRTAPRVCYFIVHLQHVGGLLAAVGGMQVLLE
jgi:hypothetical protein